MLAARSGKLNGWLFWLPLAGEGFALREVNFLCELLGPRLPEVPGFIGAAKGLLGILGTCTERTDTHHCSERVMLAVKTTAKHVVFGSHFCKGQLPRYEIWEYCQSTSKVQP